MASNPTNIHPIRMGSRHLANNKKRPKTTNGKRLDHRSSHKTKRTTRSKTPLLQPMDTRTTRLQPQRRHPRRHIPRNKRNERSNQRTQTILMIQSTPQPNPTHRPLPLARPARMTHGNVGRPPCTDIGEQRPNDTNANGDRPEKTGDQRNNSNSGRTKPTLPPRSRQPQKPHLHNTTNI